jgi:hypothetical protein
MIINLNHEYFSVFSSSENSKANNRNHEISDKVRLNLEKFV